jgi:hypothetical protein
MLTKQQARLVVEMISDGEIKTEKEYDSFCFDAAKQWLIDHNCARGYSSSRTGKYGWGFNLTSEGGRMAELSDKQLMSILYQRPIKRLWHHPMNALIGMLAVLLSLCALAVSIIALIRSHH